MGITKVGVYRKYRGPVPTDKDGNPFPKEIWTDKRPFSWAVRWFGVDGNRYSRSFPTRTKAKRFAEKKQADVRQGKADPPPNISLRDFLKEHQDVMKDNLAPKTLKMQVAATELLAESVGWQCPLRQIAVRDIERFRAERLKAGIVPATANKEIRTLKRLFNLAILRQYLPQDANPCKFIPMLKVAPERPAYLCPEQFKSLFEATPGLLWRAFVTTFYTTGIRLREAMNLTWADLDLKAGELHVTRRKGHEWVQAWTPKDHELRVIPMPPQTVELLAALKSMAPDECPYVFMDEGRWVYYRQRVEAGTWPAARDLLNNVLRKFKTICRRAKVGLYTIHDLRRSCITNWAKTTPIHVVQNLAGHSDIKTTQKYYLSIQAEDFAKARNAQEALLPDLNATPTDPKMTHKGQKRSFPGRKTFQKGEETH